MLRLLSIRQFTIIDQLDLELADGLTVITGETGAGKSLIVDVLDLLSGGRAESGLTAPGADKAELSAVFDLPPDHPALTWLEERDLRDQNNLLLRRTLPGSGPSRAWINGSPATIGQLRELGRDLIEIHGQHEHQRLMEPASQLAWLDNQLPPALLAAVQSASAEWHDSCQALEALQAEAGDPEKTEFLRFQYRELEALALKPGEFSEMEQDQQRLARVDDIIRASAIAASALDGDEPSGARERLNQAIGSLSEVSDIEPEFAPVVRLLEDARINVDEALSALDRQDRDRDADPERLAELDRRMGEAAGLARKHGVEPEDLPAVTASLAERLDRLDSYADHRARLESARDASRRKWQTAAAALSEARQKAAGKLQSVILGHLEELGMGDARLEIGVEPDPKGPVRATGFDRAEIRFSANPGQPLQALRKIASGGELSRFSLALLAAGGTDDAVRVRVFDEVDAGVGGETAHAVGAFLARAGESGQAFAVTHLAQVAARADHQLRASKASDKTTTRTLVQRLEADDRRQEIARMLGSRESERSLEHAAELLESARRK